MAHRLFSAIMALGFLILMQISGSVFRYIFAALVIYMAVLLGYNFYFLHKHKLFTFWFWIKPVFLIGALVSIYFILPNSAVKGFFLIASIGMIFLSEVLAGMISEQNNFFMTLFSYFGISLGIFAINFYLLKEPAVILLMVAFFTFCISRSSLEHIPQPAQKKNFYSLLITLAITQIAWALILLPSHFSALAVILFNIFYAFWMVIYYHLFSNLTAKKITFHFVFATLIIIFAFLSTPWKVI